MNLNKFNLLISLGLLLATILCVIAFYSLPYIKANSLIVYVNKNAINEVQKDSWVSEEEMKLLQIIDESALSDDLNISVKTSTSVTNVSWSKISFLYNINVVIKDGETQEEIDRYQGKRTVDFS